MTGIIGHDSQAAAFLSELAGGRMHHAWLLAGPEGIGKATLALAFARRALADAAGPKVEGQGVGGPMDHPVGRLVDNFSHPDLVLLERLPKDPKQTRDIGRADWPNDLERARSISIEQVRGLSHVFALKPSYSQTRIVVVDAIDDLERAAANALLKSLEEPPQGTMFLLVSHAPGRLLPTIRSRCRLMRFEALDEVAMRRVLRDKLPKVEDVELAALIAAGEGSPGKALGYAGLDIAGIDAALAKLAETGDKTTMIRHELARSLALKSAHGRYQAFLGRVPGFVAGEARLKSGDALSGAIKVWEEARTLSDSAVRQSLDPAMTVFALAGMVAGLARP